MELNVGYSSYIQKIGYWNFLEKFRYFRLLIIKNPGETCQNETVRLRTLILYELMQLRKRNMQSLRIRERSENCPRIKNGFLRRRV